MTILFRLEFVDDEMKSELTREDDQEVDCPSSPQERHVVTQLQVV